MEYILKCVTRIANDLAPDLGEIGDGSNGGVAHDNSEDPSLRFDGDEESGPPRKRQKLDADGFELLADSEFWRKS
jgi:hypothetical protein